MTKDTVKKTYIAHDENLSVIRKQIADFCKPRNIEQPTVSHLQLAVDEVCANIINHGYEKNTRDKIFLLMENNEDHVKIIVEDNAPAFNPLLQQTPDLTRHAEEYRNHGLGIYMIRRLVDEVLYHEKDNGNRLELVKYKITDALPC